MRFQACDTEGNLQAVIDAMTWFDANHYALSKFGEHVRVVAAPQDFDATVEIRWVGTDAGTGSNRRRKELRTRPTAKDEWLPWESP